MKAVDRNTEKCPTYEELSFSELIDLLREGLELECLSEWEIQFVENIIPRLEHEALLSDKQIAVLEGQGKRKGIIHKVWNAD